jgi:hypothetical protein
MTSPVPAPTTPPATHLVEAKADGNPIARAIVGAVIAGLATAIVALNNGNGIELAEWLAIIITFLVAGAAVWAVPTLRDGIGVYGKAITAALVTALGVLATGLADDGNLNTVEWLTALTALLSALAVSQTPEVTGNDAPLPPTGTTGPTTPAVR